MAAKLRKFVHQVCWYNPYTEPPDGKPRVLLSVEVMATSGTGAPPQIDALLKSIGFGKGWCHSTGAVPEPIRRLSPEAKGSVRRKSLERAVARSAPLFAEQIIEEAIAKDPAYFSGAEYKYITPAHGGAEA